MKLYIGDNPNPIPVFVWDMTWTPPWSDEPIRDVTVSPDHPNLYRLAQDAEAEGDVVMLRAIADTAKRSTKS